ncbi:MAG: hypothetical protein KBF88_08030 [Polyangiaceae bacterium]|nr:hypothetical protein [Polyangiaceae bacterium]
MKREALLLFLACGSCGLSRPVSHANEVAKKNAEAGQAESGDVSVPRIVRTEATAEGAIEKPGGPSTATTGVVPSVVPMMEERPSLENAKGLVRYFDKLSKLDHGGHAVAIQFGDSHTAADTMTGPFRRVLQERFGDGGRGFVSLGYPWKFFRQEAISGGMLGFATERASRKKDNQDGLYGLAGVAIRSTKQGASAWTDVRTAADAVEIAYLEQPGGGAFDVVIDNEVKGRVRTKAKKESSGFVRMDLPAGSAHRIELRVATKESVRIFGMNLQNKQKGVEVDALGINGARMLDVLRWDPDHFQTQVRKRSPDLVIFAYGTNESVDDAPLETHQRALVELMGRVSRAQPTSACLVVGPPDRAVRSADDPSTRTTPERLLQIVRIERAAAEAAGCAFFDTMNAMGGPGAMRRWVEDEKPQLGQKDYTHLTMAGYEKLGRQLAAELLRAYDCHMATKLNVSFSSSKRTGSP